MDNPQVIPQDIYPKLSVSHIQHPNRFWAIPIFGISVKFIILIPVYFWLLFLYIENFFVTIGNSLVVLFTSNYWDTAYTLNLGIMRLMTKATLYFYGLTDKYPGFGLGNDDPLISLDIDKPQHPNRFFAIPLLGGLVRIILLIPYLIYQSVITYAAYLGTAISSFWVLFVGRYPEPTYELARDSARLTQASAAYMAGLSDSYPSFWISMNHQTIKILLIIFGILLYLVQIDSNIFYSPEKSKNETPMPMQEKASPAENLIKSGTLKLSTANQLAKKRDLTEDDKTQIRGLINGALDDFNSATEKDPDNYVAWYYRGEAYRNLMGLAKGADSFAIESYKKAIELSPNDYNSYLALGGVYYQLKDYDNAIINFQQVVKLQPTYANGYFNLGVSYKQVGAKGEARKAIEKTLQLLPADDPTRYKTEAELQGL